MVEDANWSLSTPLKQTQTPVALPLFHLSLCRNMILSFRNMLLHSGIASGMGAIHGRSLT